MSNGFDALLVVVDCLAHYIPTTSDVNSKQIAKLFFDNIFRLHGIPGSIVSDRGTQIASKFTRTFTFLVGIQQKLSTSFHLQSDGQTELLTLPMWNNTSVFQVIATTNKTIGPNS